MNTKWIVISIFSQGWAKTVRASHTDYFAAHRFIQWGWKKRVKNSMSEQMIFRLFYYICSQCCMKCINQLFVLACFKNSGNFLSSLFYEPLSFHMTYFGFILPTCWYFVGLCIIYYLLNKKLKLQTVSTLIEQWQSMILWAQKIYSMLT